jgi:hypothetical protein
VLDVPSSASMTFPFPYFTSSPLIPASVLRIPFLLIKVHVYFENAVVLCNTHAALRVGANVSKEVSSSIAKAEECSHRKRQ